MTLAERVKAILVAAIGSGSGASYTIPDANFLIRKFPWDTKANHPGVFIVPVAERISPYTNASDKWVYGLQVTVTQPSNRDLESDHDRLHYWRERAIGQFLHHRITGLEQYFVRVEPAAAVDLTAFGLGYDATAFVLRCEVAQPRPAQVVP